MAGQWRDNGGTTAGQWRDNEGTMAGQWRDNEGTMAGQWGDNGGTMGGQWRDNGGTMAFLFVCGSTMSAMHRRTSHVGIPITLGLLLLHKPGVVAPEFGEGSRKIR